MARRKTFDQWHAEQLVRDPHFDRDTDRILARRGPPRKVPLLCDESLENELVADLRTVRDFKVTTMPNGTPDSQIWQKARRKGHVIVTADEDFWNDREFPLRDSPGVIILRGRNVEEHTTALARLSVVWDLPKNYARFVGAFFDGSKARATPRQIFHKFVDADGSVVEATW